MKNRRRSPNHRVQEPVHRRDVAVGEDRAEKLYLDMVRRYWRIFQKRHCLVEKNQEVVE